MTAITYGAPRVASTKTKRAPRKNLFVRFMDALAESRLQHAHREIVKHAHLFPKDGRGNPIGSR